MRRFALFSILIFLAADLLAVRHAVFETDVYNRAFPLERKGDIAFSPLSAEIDCALAAEALETIPRANVAESMGVLVEFAGVYRPVLDRLSAQTNGFRFVSARGFCLPNAAQPRPAFCRQIQRDYDAEVMPIFPAEGPEAWFRAAMDGEMEDFKIPVKAARSGRHCLYDLIAVRAEWVEPFPTSNVRTLSFALADKQKRQMQFMTDVRIADTWREREYLILKLPLRGDFSFYALLPNEGVELPLVRQDFSSMEIESLLARTGEHPIGNFSRGPTVLVIPRFDIDCRTDLLPALQFFRLPTSALTRLCPGVAANEYVQRLRFTLREYGRDETPLAAKPPERQFQITPETRRVILTRPFLYFIYDEVTKTIPVAGQFTGRTDE